MQSTKSKIVFLFLFIILITVSGKKDWEIDTGINYNLVVFYLLTALLFLFQILEKKRKKIVFLSNHKSVKILFFLFALTSLIITLLRDSFVITYFIFIVLTYIALIVFNQLLYKLTIKDALLIFIIAMFIVMIINLYFHFLKTGNFIVLPQVRSFDYRISGIFGAGLAGALAGLSAILPVILYLIGEKRHKIFLTLNILLAWFIMLLADNRTSMITCILIYFLIFLKYSRKNFKAKIFFLVIAITIYFFLQFYLSSTTGGRYFITDTNYRELIWGYGIEQIIQSPILGFGKQNPFDFNNLAILVLAQYNIGDPHNAYLFFILRNGIIVSFFFFSFLFLFLVLAYKKVRYTPYLILFSIPIYWLVIALTGGGYFNFSLDFSSIVFGISIFGILNHPDIQNLAKVETLHLLKN